jgi:hypothetical protein
MHSHVRDGIRQVFALLSINDASMHIDFVTDSRYILKYSLIFSFDHGVSRCIELFVTLYRHGRRLVERNSTAFDKGHTFKNGRPTMKRYSRVTPPHFSISSPAPAADPPVAIRSLMQDTSINSLQSTYVKTGKLTRRQYSSDLA